MIFIGVYEDISHYSKDEVYVEKDRSYDIDYLVIDKKDTNIDKFILASDRRL
jgi:hypothetical protein